MARRLLLILALTSCASPPTDLADAGPDAPSPPTSVGVRSVFTGEEYESSEGFTCSWPERLDFTIVDLDGVARIVEAEPDMPCPTASWEDGELDVHCQRIRYGLVTFFDTIAVGDGLVHYLSEAGPLWCMGTYEVESYEVH